jgi:hypothetical protein
VRRDALGVEVEGKCNEIDVAGTFPVPQ